MRQILPALALAACASQKPAPTAAPVPARASLAWNDPARVEKLAVAAEELAPSLDGRMLFFVSSLVNQVQRPLHSKCKNELSIAPFRKLYFVVHSPDEALLHGTFRYVYAGSLGGRVALQ